MKVKVQVADDRFGEEGFPLPSYATEGSAGLDLRAMIDKPITVHAHHEAKLIPTGLKVWIEDPNYAGMILPRSGLGHKNGIVLGNLVGLIDSDYQGELMISCWNRSEEDFTINPGDRIAQYVIVPIMQAELDIVDSFEATDRGEDGFGSSGRE